MQQIRIKLLSLHTTLYRFNWVSFHFVFFFTGSRCNNKSSFLAIPTTVGLGDYRRDVEDQTIEGGRKQALVEQRTSQRGWLTREVANPDKPGERRVRNMHRKIVLQFLRFSHSRFLPCLGKKVLYFQPPADTKHNVVFQCSVLNRHHCCNSGWNLASDMHT